jgi:hypothetical protein
MLGPLRFSQFGPQIGPPFEGRLDLRCAAAGVGRVVAIDLRRLGVVVPIHSWMVRSGTCAAASWVPNVWRSVVEGDAPDTRSAQRLREALADLRGIEDVPGLRMAEDQVIVSLVSRGLEEPLELAGEPVGHRDGAPSCDFGESV